MAMGTWFFTRKDKDARGASLIIHENGWDDGPKYMDGLRNFIAEWDEYLKITGQPMRFTATGPKVTDWGACM